VQQEEPITTLLITSSNSIEKELEKLSILKQSNKNEEKNDDSDMIEATPNREA
jgi:hypothetical protein